MAGILVHVSYSFPHMNTATDSELYAAHIEELQQRYTVALANHKLDAVLIANGRPGTCISG